MPKESQSASKGTLLLVVMVVLIILAIRYGWIPWNNTSGPTVSPIYDTDAANDRFIKGELSADQMKTLDRILTEEQKQNGVRLSNETIKKLAKNDKAVMDAYARWRKCHDMMRSRHYVIYPNQRNHIRDNF